MAPITPTQLPATSQIRTNGNGHITGGLKKTAYVSLVEERDQLTRAHAEAEKRVSEANETTLGLTKQISELTSGNAELHKQIETKNTEVSELSDLVSDRDIELKAATVTLNQQAEQIRKLEAALEDALRSLKDAGKHAKSEQSKDIKEKVWNIIKEKYYRTIKFVRDQELTDLAISVYQDIKDDIADDEGNPICQSEFLRIYEGYVQESLGGRRQYTQTSLMEAMVGKSLKFVCLT